MGYVSHFFTALSYAVNSLITSVVFFIHAFAPSLFTSTGTNRVANLYLVSKAGNSGSDRILIRFNTKYQEDEFSRCWRVLVNGDETLVYNVYVNVPSETIVESIDTGEIKHHLLCWGKARFVDNTAIIE